MTGRPGFDLGRAGPNSVDEVPFHPLQLNPFVWYDGEDLVGLYNEADPLDGQGWPSHLAGGDALIIGGEAPSFSPTGGPNGKPGAYFDGIGQFMTMPTTAASGAKTFYWIYDPDDATASRTLFNSTTGLLNFLHEGATGNTAYNHGGGNKACGAKSDVAQLLVFSLGSSAQRARRNGVDLTITSPTWSDVSIGGLTYVGCNGGTANFCGMVLCGFIAFNAAHSLAEIQQMEAFINDDMDYNLF